MQRDVSWQGLSPCYCDSRTPLHTAGCELTRGWALAIVTVRPLAYISLLPDIAVRICTVFITAILVTANMYRYRFELRVGLEALWNKPISFPGRVSYEATELNQASFVTAVFCFVCFSGLCLVFVVCMLLKFACCPVLSSEYQREWHCVAYADVCIYVCMSFINRIKRICYTI